MINTRIKAVIAFLFLLSSPFVGVYAACCSGHGGVASCNTATGFKMCKDGTPSPSCKCKKVKATTKSKNSTTIKKTKSTSSWWSGKPATKSTLIKSTSPGSRGCCSKHGGVAQCDLSTGHLVCKDGIQSPTCGCH